MAFFGGLLAGAAGMGQGRVQAYQDQVARQAQMDQLAELQRQFNQAQAEKAREFDTSTQLDKEAAAERNREFGLDYGLRSAQNQRDQGAYDRTQQQWQPGGKGKPGGYLWQRAQQDLKAGQQGLQTGALQNIGLGLSNQAQTIANTFAPIRDQLTAQTMQANIGSIQAGTAATRQGIANSEGDTVAHRDEQAKRQAELQAKLARQTYTYESWYDSVIKGPTGGVNMPQVQKDFTAASHNVAQATAALNAVDKNGMPRTDPKLKAVIGNIAQRLTQSQNPLQDASTIISDPSMAPLREAGYVGLVLEMAEAERLRRILAGQQTQQQPAPQQAPPIPAPGAPYPYNVFPGPFSSSYGGSQNAAPFSRP